MTQQATPPAAPAHSSPARSSLKWIALVLGGGCALIACILVVVALVTGSFLLPIRSVSGPPTPSGNAVPVLTEPAPSLRRSGSSMGDPAAPVKIVEYADFQCPYCMRYWQETEPQIIESYVKTGKVFYEYRSVGGFLGEESQAAAEAAYCAADQGKFWEYRDALFSHWTGENVGDFAPERLKQYAASTGLDQQTFDACLDGHDKAQRVQQDVENAGKDGIQATPSFLINGNLIEGAMPFDAFQQAIEEALQGK